MRPLLRLAPPVVSTGLITAALGIKDGPNIAAAAAAPSSSSPCPPLFSLVHAALSTSPFFRTRDHNVDAIYESRERATVRAGSRVKLRARVV